MSVSYDHRTCTKCGKSIDHHHHYQWTMVHGLPVGAEHVLCPETREELEAMAKAARESQNEHDPKQDVLGKDSAQ